MAESLEVTALRALAAHIGARVSDVATPDVHSATSWHYAPGTGGTGLAVDLAEPGGPSALTPGLRRIAAEVARLAGPWCNELIYAEGPSLRLGRPYRYSAPVLRAHRNHVHVAVRRGFRFEAPAPPEVRPMWEPPLSVCATLKAPNGGVWGLGPDGGVYAFEGAPFYGSAAGQGYFVGRRAARLEARPDGGYDIIATSGERYQYPAS